eukprot:jgi/Chrpa1/3702/Chrysochromulina_OHIO_Genome00015622-RA
MVSSYMTLKASRAREVAPASKATSEPAVELPPPPPLLPYRPLGLGEGGLGGLEMGGDSDGGRGG